MANYRLTFFFSAKQQGFTEQFYFQSNTVSPKAALNQIEPDLFNNAFLNLRTAGTRFLAIRVSDVDNPRVSYLNPVDLTTPLSESLERDLSPDLAGVSALVKFTTDLGRSRRLWIRSLSDTQTVLNRSGASTPPSVITNAINAYARSIINNNLCLRAVKPNLSPYNYNPVVTFIPHPVNFNWTQVSVVLPAQPAGVTRVVFNHLDQHQLPGLRGSFPVLFNANNLITIPYKLPYGGSVVVPGAAARWQGFDYLPLLTFVFERFVTRKTGKIPFGVSAGKSPPGLRRR